MYVRQGRAGRSLSVKVVLESQIHKIVNVSPNAFSRLHGQVGNERIDEYQRAAISGAMSALTDTDVGGVLTILEVDCFPADSTPDDVRESSLIATTLAVRKSAGR
jgi:hypothetical protein